MVALNLGERAQNLCKTAKNCWSSTTTTLDQKVIQTRPFQYGKRVVSGLSATAFAGSAAALGHDLLKAGVYATMDCLQSPGKVPGFQIQGSKSFYIKVGNADACQQRVTTVVILGLATVATVLTAVQLARFCIFGKKPVPPSTPSPHNKID